MTTKEKSIAALAEEIKFWYTEGSITHDQWGYFEYINLKEGLNLLMYYDVGLHSVVGIIAINDNPCYRSDFYGDWREIEPHVRKKISGKNFTADAKYFYKKCKNILNHSQPDCKWRKYCVIHRDSEIIK